MINEKETEAWLDFRVLANDTNDLIFSCAGMSCCCMRSSPRSSQTTTITWQVGSCWWRWEPVWIESLGCQWNLRFNPFWNQLPELISPAGILRGALGKSRQWNMNFLLGWELISLFLEESVALAWKATTSRLLAAWSGWTEGPAAPQPMRSLEQCHSFSWGINPRCLSHHPLPFLELGSRAGNTEGPDFLLCVWQDGQQSELCVQQFDFCTLLGEPQWPRELERGEEEWQGKVMFCNN